MEDTTILKDGTPGSGVPPGTITGNDNRAPTQEERLTLIRCYQARALLRTDPLAANLDIISGDLMAFASRMQELLQERQAQAPSSAREYERFYRDADMYLRVIRQIGRLAQIGRRLSSSDGE
jgi:hypothetical protein